MTGRLVLVATPIGNLEDLSPRAAEALRAASAIACEDTRRTGKLLHLTGIAHGPLLVVNDHTEAAMAPEVVGRIRGGEVVALVTDAGTPGIADPGERVVRAVLDAELPVEVVPGPSAPIAALVASGLPTGRFVFEGFLPRKGAARRERLAEVSGEPRTVLLLEAPHRLLATLRELATVCGADRPVALARELTKLHEEVWRGTLGEAVEHIETVGVRGEYALVLGGAPAPVVVVDDATLLAAVDAARRRGVSTRDAVAEVVASTGAPRRRVYDLATSGSSSDSGDEGADGPPSRATGEDGTS